ncbi:MAG: alanine racemase [Pseudomonadota bacterium]
MERANVTVETALPLRPSWAEVDLDAVAFNVRQIRALVAPGVRVFTCMKCDACGCGAVEVARAVEQAGGDGLAFGDVDAALACRRAGVALPILLYPSCLPDAAPLLARERLMPSLSTLADVRAWDAAADAPLDVFLKIDGGALRAGALPDAAAQVAAAIHASRHLRLAGAYGHPVAYGLADPRYEAEQIAAIERAFDAVARAVPLPVRMLSSSEIFLKHPRLDGDAVDPGRLVLGMDFPAVPERDCAWRPALAGIKSRLVMAKDVDLAGDVVAAPYFPLRPGMRIGLIPLGWDAGLPRKLPQEPCVLVRGRRVRLLPPVHAELTRVDLTDVPEAAVGDEVVLLGEGDGARIDIATFCALWSMQPLDLHTGLAGRLPKRYLGQPLHHNAPRGA